MCSLRRGVFALMAVCTLLFAASAAAGPLDTALFAAGSSLCPAAIGPQNLQPAFLAVTAYCEADCWNDSTVSCSGTTCSAVDSSCPSQRGYVQCGTSTYYCPVCPTPACSPNGSTRWVNYGCCCGAPVAKQNHRQQICVGGSWQYTSNYSCYGSCSDPYGCDW